MRTLISAQVASLKVRRLGYGIDGAYLPYSSLADDEPAAREASTDKLLEDMARLQKVRLSVATGRRAHRLLLFFNRRW